VSHSHFIELSQGWTKGLKISFENQENSMRLQKKDFFHIEQVHGQDIYKVTEADLTRVGPLAKADGLWIEGDWFKTCKKPLLVTTADCIPLVLVSEEDQVVALIHAGWRGLQQGIHTKLLDEKRFHSKRVWAWVGPSLGPEHFEVREDMWTQFPKNIQDNENIFKKTKSSLHRNFHAWRLIELDLKQRGVELVYNFEEDTFANEKFSSYRRYQKALARGPAEPSTLKYSLNYTWLSFSSP